MVDSGPGAGLVLVHNVDYDAGAQQDYFDASDNNNNTNDQKELLQEREWLSTVQCNGQMALSIVSFAIVLQFAEWTITILVYANTPVH